MKNQALFSLKDKSKKLKCCLLQFMFGALRVKATSLNRLFNSLTTKKQTTKFLSANFQKMFSPSYIILRTQRQEGK